jgi:RNA polymerase sigma-70 factor, ECF subfamily
METLLVGQMTGLDPDIALVRRMAAADEQALQALYAAHVRRLFAYAYRLTQNQALAEEVLQDSLLAAWKGARSYRGEGRVIAWLLGIVHRQALNATRRVRPPSASLEDAEDAGALPAAQSADLPAALDREQALATAMADLSAEHRAVLELVFYQGLALAEAAQVCGCPVGTIKSRLSYAKAHLRRSLDAAGITMEDLL